MDIVEKARVFATAAHAAIGQKRKYTDEPYIVHPTAVVQILRGVGATNAMLAAAWLHDVVEDTGVKMETIQREFGDYIALIVGDLTDISQPEDGNREMRKTIDREHTARACSDAMTIKLADLIDNTSTIVKHDPGFATVYLREKTLLLEVLVEGDKTLWDQAMSLVQSTSRGE